LRILWTFSDQWVISLESVARKNVGAFQGGAWMHRHELSDAQWERIKDLFPVAKSRGRPPADPRQMVNAALWILRTGAPWRDLPERFGPWETAYGWFNQWSANGTWDRLLSRLQAEMDRAGRIDWELFCIDGSSVRASRAAAGARKKRKAPSR
jgi:transposase